MSKVAHFSRGRPALARSFVSRDTTARAMRRAACRLASRAASGATASTRAVGLPGSGTWTSLGEVSRVGRHPSSATGAFAIARDARRLGAALAGFGAFALAGVDASPTHASATGHVQSSPVGASAVRTGSAQPAFGEGSRPDPEALAALAADVSSGPAVARRRALRLLTQVTLFVDHHDAVLAVPEVLRALLAVVARSERQALGEGDEKNARMDPSSTSLAARCLADLAKSPRARAALVADARALRALADGLRAETRDDVRERRDAPEGTRREPGIARDEKAPEEPANASRTVESTRLAAELAGDAACHAPMVAAGVIAALARADAEAEASLGRWRNRAWRRLETFFWLRRRKRWSASSAERAAESRVSTERARHSAAAWFGLAGSSEGSAAIAAADAAGFGVTRRMRRVAGAESDRVAFRYAVGCLARLAAGGFFHATSSGKKGEPVRQTWRALAAALRSGDGQAACFAAGTARAALSGGSARARAALTERGFVDGALFLLTSPEKGWCAEKESREKEKADQKFFGRRDAPSAKRTDGARLCALRLLHAFASSGDDSTRRAVAVKGATVLGEFAAGSRRGAGASAAIRDKASAVLTELGL